MKAVLLVGGEGTRLRPLTYTTPKQMLPIAEVSMLERVLGQLRPFGVDQAVLSLGYRPGAFMAAFPGGSAAGVRLEYVVEEEPLDTAGAIGFAARSAGIESTFLAANGDVLTDLDVGSLVALHRRRAAEATIHLTPVADPSAFGVVSTDGEGRVLAFVEKPSPDDAATNLINAGTYVLEPSVLERIEPGRPVSMEREVFPSMAAEGTLFALATDDYWLDTGTPEKYLQAQRDILTGRRPLPVAPGARRLGNGAWVLGRPAVAGSVSQGSLVGDGAIVEGGAEVEASVVGHGCRVCADARVRSSVLLPGATVERSALVEGSIVGKGAVVSEGSAVTELSVLGDGVTTVPGSRLRGAKLPDGAGRRAVASSQGGR